MSARYLINSGPYGVFADWHQLDSTPAFADGVLLISKSGVNHAERAQTLGIVRLVVHHFLEFCPGFGERGPRRRLVASHACGETFAPTVREGNACVVAPTGRHGGQRALGRGGIPLA